MTMVAGRTAQARRRGTLAWGVALSLVIGPLGTARSADLPYPTRPPPPIVRGYVEVDPDAYLGTDLGPASSNGYYGFYGTDILGVPYRGLYSENVLCIRSVLTRNGYRTAYVC